MNKKFPEVRLKAGEQGRILAGHPWVYRNEIERVPEGTGPGEIVDVLDRRGRFVGRGYHNSRSQIAVRILSLQAEPIDERFITGRLERARDLRLRLFPHETAHRLVFSEGDLLPGLIVDRYGDYLAVQSLTAGMERLLPAVLAGLRRIANPRAIVLRNDVAVRALEGLGQEVRVEGEAPTELWVRRNGVELAVDLLAGQKTGLYLDQAENYDRLAGLVQGAEVLDGFCYAGAWGLHAARHGARRVLGLDSSKPAIEQARRNSRRNGVDAICRFETGQVFDELKAYDQRRERFDCIILDPPSFVRSRQRVEDAVRGYKEINLRAMRLLRPGGILVTCSCSYHLSPQRFLEMLREAASDVRRQPQLLELRGQARDHPALLALPESSYLKCAILKVL